MRHKHANAFLQRRLHLGSPNELRNVRRTDLLFAFGDQHQIDRHLLASAANCMQRCEECCFWSFLIHCAATDHHIP
jgi:hypothetical protein